MYLRRGARLFVGGLLIMLAVAGCKAPEFEGGVVHLNAGRFDEAIAHFELALKDDPTNPEIHLYMVKAYVNKSDFDNALEHLNIAEEKDVSAKMSDKIADAREDAWFRVYNDFALFEFESGDLGKALEYFQLCSKLDPSKKESYFGAGASATLLSQEKNIEAANLEEQMKDPQLTEEEVAELQAQVDALDEEIDELHLVAIDSFKQALLRDPENVEYLTNLSSAYLDAGMMEEASLILEQLLTKNPDNPEITYKVARSHHLVGELESAKGFYTQTLEMDPEHSDALYYIGCIYMDNDLDYNSAIPHFEKYVVIIPDDIVAWARLVQAYGKIGETEKALEASKKIEELESSQ